MANDAGVLPEPAVETAAAGEAAQVEPTTVRLADELVARAAQTSATIRFIEDPDLLADFGGVAAILRFSI
jgi:peptide subunit release factor 1 (eRF1)